ncbi:MAG: hypothetical protein LBQ60_18565 [Bacteroidales bacterium]|nr:hypothetical protein [Bacteroidales bacterium]
MDTHGSGAIISILENEGSKYIVIVNRDYKHNMRFTFAAHDSMKQVLKDGSIVPADSYTGTITILPGDIMIFMY